MTIKNFIGAILVGLIFFSGVAQAYDLPKIKVEKPKKTSVENSGIMKSSWENLEAFEEQIKILSEKGLTASAKERVYIDKNNIFIAVYKGNFYFLDRYSVKVRKDAEGVRSWRQKIFSLGKNVSAINTSATEQNFCTDGKNFYNSSRKKNDLAQVENEDDKKFLEECFKVGYYYAFGEEFEEDSDENFD